MTPPPTDPAEAAFAAARDRLLDAALVHVPFDGWSGATLAQAARDLGWDPAEALRLFPRGPIEAIEHHSLRADRRMLQAVGSQGTAGLRLRERVALAIRLRLEPLAGEREAIRRALGVLALPQNAPVAARLLYRTVDAIWYAAGDTATDFSFYTKRGLLAGVYGATVLYWLEDRSEGARDSAAFLDRRIADALSLPGALTALRDRLAAVVPAWPPRPRG